MSAYAGCGKADLCVLTKRIYDSIMMIYPQTLFPFRSFLPSSPYPLVLSPIHFPDLLYPHAFPSGAVAILHTIS